MKITKSQKEAVIELLKEKFKEKQKTSDEKFLKEHKKEIEKNIKYFLEKQEEIKKHLEAARKIMISLSDDKDKEGNVNCGIELRYNWYYRDSNKVINEKTKEDAERYITTPKVECPDYYKVNRQLELDSLSKDFDLDAFLQKYLED